MVDRVGWSGKKRGENMKKREKSLFKTGLSTCLAVLMIFTMVANSGTLSAMSQTEFFGIHPVVSYSEDYSSATITINTADTKSDEIDIVEILDPENKPLDMSNPQITVTENGEYSFTVKYSEKKADEVTIDEQESTSDAAATSIDTSIDEETAEVTEQEKTEDSNATNDDPVQSEIKSFVVTAVVDGVKKSEVKAEDKSTLNNPAKAKEEASFTKSTVSRAVSNSVRLDEIFDTTKWATLRGTSIDSVIGMGQELNGNIITAYSPTASFIPEDNGNFRWQGSSLLPSKDKVSLRQNWKFEGTVEMPSSDAIKSKDGKQIDVTSAIILSNGSWISSSNNEIAVLGLSKNSDNPNETKTYSRIHLVDQRPEADVPALSTNSTARMTITYTYTGDYASNNTGKLTLECEGAKKELTLSSLPETAEFLLYNQVQYGSTSGTKSSYPIFKNTFTFASFGYEDYNPLLMNVRWFKDGTEISDGTIVEPGQELTVKATMKNDVSTSGRANVVLKLSDDASKAVTKGVESISNTDGSSIATGIPVVLTKEGKEVTFKVKVKDTIGNISLGVMMEDDFFHSKQYKELSSKIDIGKVFMDGVPVCRVVELDRDPSTGAIRTEAGVPKFVDAADQNSLNQDSFVEITIGVVNPRNDNPIALELILDKTKAPGLDFSQVYVTKNGLGAISATAIKNWVQNGGSYNINIGTGGDGKQFTFIVPVKQTSYNATTFEGGKPFDKGQQNIGITLNGTVILPSETVTGQWTKEKKISDSIIDIDTYLNTNSKSVTRGQTIKTVLASDFNAETPDSGASVDFSSVSTKNQGTSNDWKYFGLESESDQTGIVPLYADDGKTLKVDVTCNKSLMLSGGKHWTRVGSDLNAPFRERKKTLTLTVSGGTVSPTAYFEIPDTVYLNDSDGIDQDHAGIKANIGLVDGIDTNKRFTIAADNNFKIKNGANQEHIVTLYDASKNLYPASALGVDKANIGTITNTDRTKTVWFNLVKDPNRTSSQYKGTMNFYITMN